MGRAMARRWPRQRARVAGWRPGVDVAIGPDAGNSGPAGSLDPGRTPPVQTPAGTVVRLGDGVELVRLPAGDGWLLRYGEFTALLPPTLRPEAQAALLQSTLESLPVTLLKTPGAGAASWPTAAFLDAIRPQIILWPRDTTYPPDVAEWLTSHGASRVAEDAVVEVTVVAESVGAAAQHWRKAVGRADAGSLQPDTSRASPLRTIRCTNLGAFPIDSAP